jgi:glycine/serine hydroxymethyltransferase
MCLFPHDLAALRAAVGPETIIHYDGSHTLGLIAAGQFQDPLCEGADSLGGSTHKTFPGPHKGVLLTNRADLAARFDEHASHFVSHHHPADVASLAVAVGEMQARGMPYAQRAIDGARHLAADLAAHGFAICAAERGWTRSHQLWVDIAPIMPAERASQRLLGAGIVVNAINVPYTPSGTGLRLGVQEAAWTGMGAAAMREIADIFAAVLLQGRDPQHTRRRVHALLETHWPPPLAEETKLLQDLFVLASQENS